MLTKPVPVAVPMTNEKKTMSLQKQRTKSVMRVGIRRIMMMPHAMNRRQRRLMGRKSMATNLLKRRPSISGNAMTWISKTRMKGPEEVAADLDRRKEAAKVLGDHLSGARVKRAAASVGASIAGAAAEGADLPPEAADPLHGAAARAPHQDAELVKVEEASAAAVDVAVHQGVAEEVAAAVVAEAGLVVDRAAVRGAVPAVAAT